MESFERVGSADISGQVGAVAVKQIMKPLCEYHMETQFVQDREKNMGMLPSFNYLIQSEC